MRFLRSALALTILLAVSTSAQTGLTGTWEIEKVRPVGYLMADFNVVLDLKTDGKKLTGTANLGNLGDAAITDGVIDGERFSFTAMTGNISSSGPWKMTFDGAVPTGGTLKLATNYGWGDWTAPNGQSKLELEAKRVSN